LRNFVAGASGILVAGTLWLYGCGSGNTEMPATVTLNKDKTQFSGNVVRRDSSSITLVGDQGVTHTFLLTEVSDIRYGAPILRIPAGTPIAVRASELIDSCCAPIGTIEVGVSDADVKGPDGKVLIPQGANLTFVVRDRQMTEGSDTLQFELGSADFANRHYLISSAQGGHEPGAVLTISSSRNPAAGSDTSAKTIHLYYGSLMDFRTETPVTMK
jgi:hypothetical protein